MCKSCEEKPVYEFTNKRKLCKRCFINYFHKKLLYTIRKFGMVKPSDVVGYKKTKDFRGVVLEEMLFFLKKKFELNLIKLPNEKANKIAVSSSLDFNSEGIIDSLIDGKIIDLKKYLPIEKKIIKPLYYFLDEEILLYARLKGLNFKEDKGKKNSIKEVIDGFEKTHPEVKRAIVNSLLTIYK